MGLNRKAAEECLRFSLSQANTKEEIDQAIRILAEACSYVRSTLKEAC